MGLDQTLQRLCESGESIKDSHFKNPGIFSNALLLEPETTLLIRDANEDESIFYKNKSIDEFDRELLDSEPSNGDADIAEHKKGLLNFDQASTDPFIAMNQYLQLVSKKKDLLTDPDITMEQAVNILHERLMVGTELYTTPEISEKTSNLITKANELIGEIKNYETSISLQQEKLNKFNNNLNDRDLGLSDTRNPSASNNGANAKDLILIEEKEIEDLEKQISELQ
ncbi:hypothetical protein B5S28_g3349 [[Candida] boidinii]|nr:hypothetical protein B5S28_g3349 [[Candida] boidinii]OWB70477.1 hypothetical protein B5S31_g155 [[Candida] boidinii]GME68823.1 unnamed protein product [[Candida] boidinii]